MYFKNPEYLPFYLFVLIPIIIHFLRFNKYVNFYYSNVNFIKNILLKNKKYNEIKNILLLIIRTIFIALLVSIFTQPYFSKKKSNNNYQDGSIVIFYFDNDFSTNFISDDGNTILDKAKNDIISLVDNSLFNPENITIMTNNSSNTFNNDKDNSKKEIINIDTYYQKKSLEEIYQKVQLTFNQKPNSKKKLILITTKNNDYKLENPSIDISFLKYKPKTKENILIKNIFLNSNSDNNTKEIKVIVETHDIEKISTILKMYIKENDRYSLVDTKNIEIKNNTDTISFFITMDDKLKYLSGKFLIEDNLSKINFDDDFFFTLNKKSNKTVSLIYEKNENEFISKIFNDDYIDYIPQKKYNLNITNIKKSNVIVYDEIINFDDNYIQEIENFMEEGKTIIIIPNINTSLENLNNITSYFEICKISSIKKGLMYIDKINYKHYFFNNVFYNKVEGNIEFPFSKTNLFTTNISSDILAEFSNKEPALFYKKIKNGNILFFTFPFNKDNSNIYDHSLIVPFLYKNLDYSGKENIYATIGEYYSQYFTYDKIMKNSSIFLKHEDKKIIPNFSVNSSNELKIYTSFLPENKGIYSVLVDKTIIGEISYNFSRSYFDSYGNDKYDVEKINDIKNLLLNENKTTMLTGKLFVLICLLLLLSESLLANKKQKYI